MTTDELRAYLAKHGVSQRELARRLQESPSFVFRRTTGRLEIRHRDWLAIQHVVECEIHDE